MLSWNAYELVRLQHDDRLRDAARARLAAEAVAASQSAGQTQQPGLRVLVRRLSAAIERLLRRDRRTAAVQVGQQRSPLSTAGGGGPATARGWNS
jgi:hypothetical protein